jgi:hypothetical protein
VNGETTRLQVMFNQMLVENEEMLIRLKLRGAATGSIDM